MNPNGMSIMSKLRKPSSEQAQWNPSAEYMYGAVRGINVPKIERVVEAMLWAVAEYVV